MAEGEAKRAKGRLVLGIASEEREAGQEVGDEHRDDDEEQAREEEEGAAEDELGLGGGRGERLGTIDVGVGREWPERFRL